MRSATPARCGGLVEWLFDAKVVDDDAARRYLEEHPDPEVP